MDRYYTGVTEDIEWRLERYNQARGRFPRKLYNTIRMFSSEVYLWRVFLFISRTTFSNFDRPLIFDPFPKGKFIGSISYQIRNFSPKVFEDLQRLTPVS